LNHRDTDLSQSKDYYTWYFSTLHKHLAVVVLTWVTEDKLYQLAKLALAAHNGMAHHLIKIIPYLWEPHLFLSKITGRKLQVEE